MYPLKTKELLSNWNALIANELELNRFVGVAVVFHDGVETNHLMCGQTSKTKGTQISINTKFEIASLTKIFTGLICARLILDKKISLDSKIGDFDLFKNSGNISKITVKELLTHSSGLPRIPSNIKPTNPLNPYSDYTEEMLFEELSKLTINSKEYHYSNLGYAVLGKILSFVGDKRIECQLNELFKDLELYDTEVYQGITINELSESHNEKLEKVPHWDSNVFNSSGGVISTAHDLTHFCHQLLVPHKSKFSNTLLLSMKEIFQNKDLGVAMGWHIYEKSKIYSHNGATYGNFAKIRLIPSENKFLIYLSNTYNELEQLDIGL